MTIAGLGVAALGLGTVSGFEALSKNRDSNAHGNCRGNLCDAAGFDARTTARSDGARATGLIGVGAAAIVIGAVLWLTVPGRHGTGGSGELKIGVSPSGARCAWVF